MAGKGKWLLLALAASLAANLFLVGVLAGRHTERLRGSAAIAARADNFQARLRTLPGDQRALFDAAIREKGPELRALGRRLRQDGDAARAAMRAEPYDPAALDRALAVVRRDTDALQAALHAQVVVGLGRLTPASRARLAER